MRSPSLDRRRALLLAAAQQPLLLPLAAPAIGGVPTPSQISLSDRTQLPLATFGLQIYDDMTALALTQRALDAGFRSFFTSPEGGNQRGFAQAIRESGIPRHELFLAGSVLSDDADAGFENARSVTRARFAESLRTLRSEGIESLDMLMLERPGRGCACIRGQWRACQEKREQPGRRQAWACATLISRTLTAWRVPHTNRRST